MTCFTDDRRPEAWKQSTLLDADLGRDLQLLRPKKLDRRALARVLCHFGSPADSEPPPAIHYWGASRWPAVRFSMAFTGEAFGVALGINGAICLAVFLFFGLLRRATFAQKFYAPKL